MLKLQDNDKATTDAWFFAVYSAITEPKRPTVRCGGGDDVGYKFAAVLTSRMRDEHTDGMVGVDVGGCSVQIECRY